MCVWFAASFLCAEWGWVGCSGVDCGVGDGVLAGVDGQEDVGVCFIFAGAPMYDGTHEEK